MDTVPAMEANPVYTRFVKALTGKLTVDGNEWIALTFGYFTPCP
jgi:hypothetical protein